VPQKPFVPQPAFQPEFEYAPPEVGNEKSALGLVLSIRNVRLGPVSVFDALSVALTWTV
jgi:hypothetical protein